jgi:hypothetical protein
LAGCAAVGSSGLSAASGRRAPRRGPTERPEVITTRAQLAEERWNVSVFFNTVATGLHMRFKALASRSNGSTLSVGGARRGGMGAEPPSVSDTQARERDRHHAVNLRRVKMRVRSAGAATPTRQWRSPE